MTKNKVVRMLLIGLAGLVLSGVASAAALCSAGGQDGPNPFQIVTGTLTQNGSLTSSFSCSIGSYTFSNFDVFGNVINEPGGISNFTLTESSSGLGIGFGFPNLSAFNDDFELSFQISPGVAGETLSAGPGTVVSEVICSGVVSGPGGVPECSGTVLSQNPNWTASNGGSSSSLVTLAGTDFVFKDVRGGSSLSQTIIPEPMTYSLMGAGLLGLGFLGRKLRRK